MIQAFLRSTVTLLIITHSEKPKNVKIPTIIEAVLDPQKNIIDVYELKIYLYTFVLV